MSRYLLWYENICDSSWWRCHVLLPTYVIEGNSTVPLKVNGNQQATFSHSGPWLLNSINESRGCTWTSGKEPQPPTQGSCSLPFLLQCFLLSILSVSETPLMLYCSLLSLPSYSFSVPPSFLASLTSSFPSLLSLPPYSLPSGWLSLSPPRIQPPHLPSPSQDLSLLPWARSTPCAPARYLHRKWSPPSHIWIFSTMHVGIQLAQHLENQFTCNFPPWMSLKQADECLRGPFSSPPSNTKTTRYCLCPLQNGG